MIGQAKGVVLALSWGMMSLTTSASIASAQNEDAVNAADDSTVIYDQVYFEQYKPVTLQDMIRNVPGGITIVSGLLRQQQGRGFGSTGAQVLINGKRMAGKVNDMANNLVRIQASQVDRIELIRGTAEGLDVRSEGILLNVILKEGSENTSSTYVDARVIYTRGANPTPEALISHNGTKGALEYGVSYQYDRQVATFRVTEDIFEPDFTPRQFRLLRRLDKEKNHLFTGRVGYTFANGHKTQFNALYEDNDANQRDLEDQFDILTDGARSFAGIEDARFLEANKKWEIGGDHEGEIGGIGTLKALFVVNRTEFDDRITQDQITPDVMGGDTVDRFFENVSDSVEEERIFRASLTSQVATKHSLEFGGEGAFNTLDKTQIFSTAADETTVVNEDRYEIFATHTFAISDKLNLASSVNEEFSKIVQRTAGITNSRSFKYLKPRAEFRYDINPRNQIRLVVERTVSQLDLNNFVASRNVEDDVINFGNPNLVPEKTWTYLLAFEHRFANDGGSFEVELSYDDISDHIDKIQIGEFSSGVGNIGNARRLTMETELSIRFGFIGAPNAVMTMEYDLNETNVLDPFTGQNRELNNSGTRRWNVDFQHDITSIDVTYGFNIHKRTPNFRTDIFLQERNFSRRHVRLFSEYKFAKSSKLRFEVNHPLNDFRAADRVFFDGNIADNVVSRIDLRENRKNTDLVLSLQSTF